MNSVHLTMQGKGGVGKSLIAAFITQYFKSTGANVICADTDPVNATFAQYKSLDVAHVEIAKDGNVIQTKFDPLIQLIVETASDFVIDNGSATFLPLTKYLADNDIFEIMADHGKKVFIHTVLTGGQAKTDTYNGFSELLSKVGKYAKVVVWENEFWGPVEYEGHSIRSTKLFKEAERAGKISGIVNIADQSRNDGRIEALQKMTSKHMTLADAKASGEFHFLEINRLEKIVKPIFSELALVNW